ncbi:MAG TPA: Holliday junction branch migration protein RuvA [Gammaproteobacteria bacterium]|nr:Holliday junction branch migration protein RuvA [Gammaproteobacteria bacterium]HRA42543.1 Holliday junction branch migration protein RuvA [Gammaproteobacteria bacterium]
MIGRLRGILEVKKPPYLLIEVGGVGYELQAPMSTIYKLPEVGSPVTLFTHFQVREDAQVLYGFYEERERTLFKTLIKVSGVGPKMALTILSGMDVLQFIKCVDNRETALLVRLPGVGQKTAERLIIEMSGKLNNVVSSENENFSRRLFEEIIDAASPRAIEEEAVSALIALGYKPQEATRAIGRVLFEGASSQELIRRALQGLARV